MKNIALFFLFFSSSFCFALNPNHFSNVEASTTAVCILHFDEGSGTEAHDHSGLKNDCTTFSGNTAWVSDGVGGKALSFPNDTVSSIQMPKNQFKDLFDRAPIPIFTVHWRMKFDLDATVDSYIYSFQRDSAVGNFEIYRNSNTIMAIDGVSRPTWTITEDSTFGTIKKHWHDYDMIKYQNNPPKYELFVDGLSTGTQGQNTGAFNPGFAVGDNTIGGRNGGGNSCNCQIGEFDIFWGSVSKNNIRSIHYASIYNSE